MPSLQHSAWRAIEVFICQFAVFALSYVFTHFSTQMNVTLGAVLMGVVHYIETKYIA